MVEKHFLELTFSIKGDRSVTLTYETLTNTATNETVALSKVLNASVDDSASMNLLGTFVAGQRGCIRVDMAKLGLAASQFFGERSYSTGLALVVPGLAALRAESSAQPRGCE